MIEALILSIPVLLCVALVRNNVTLSARLWFIDNQRDLYDRLPSYEAMFLSPRFLLFWKPTHWLAWVKRQQAGESA